MSVNSTNTDFIGKLREFGESAADTIAEAKKQFDQCLVEASRGSAQIVKQWAKEIKNNPEQLEVAYDYAEETGLLQKYCEMLAEGKSHRVCYRTVVVNNYIYSIIRQAESDSLAVDDLLNELNGEGEE